MRKFIAIYYTGKNGSGSMSALFYDGEVIGLDAAGALIKGTYEGEVGAGVRCQLSFNFEPGSQLVTGQVVKEPVSIPFSIEISNETFNGSHQRADFPTGPINFKVQILKDIA